MRGLVTRGLIAVLLGLLLVAAPAYAITVKQQGIDPKTEANILLRDIIYEAKFLVQELDSLNTPGLSRESHVIALGVAAERVNRLAQMVNRLREIREHLYPWQVTAAVRIARTQADLARAVEMAVKELNQEGTRALAPKTAYRMMLNEAVAYARELREDARTFLAFAETREKLAETYRQMVERITG